MLFTNLAISEPQRNWLGETDIAPIVAPFRSEMNPVNSTGYTVVGYVTGIAAGLIRRSDIGFQDTSDSSDNKDHH